MKNKKKKNYHKKKRKLWNEKKILIYTQQRGEAKYINKKLDRVKVQNLKSYINMQICCSDNNIYNIMGSIAICVSVRNSVYLY